MRLSVDASVVVKWFVSQPLSENARLLLAHRLELHAPDLLASSPTFAMDSSANISATCFFAACTASFTSMMLSCMRDEGHHSDFHHHSAPASANRAKVLRILS